METVEAGPGVENPLFTAGGFLQKGRKSWAFPAFSLFKTLLKMLITLGIPRLQPPYFSRPAPERRRKSPSLLAEAEKFPGILW